MQRTGFMVMDTGPMDVRKDQKAGFYGLTVARDKSFSIPKRGQCRHYDRSHAHLLAPDETFHFRSDEGTSILVANFFVDNLSEYAGSLEDDTRPLQLPPDASISLLTPTGAGLSRYLGFVCGELKRGGGILNSELVAKEVEDSLLAAFVLAISESTNRGKQEENRRHDGGVSRVEEYLAANLSNPVSREHLAELAGVSIRTLSRAFAKRHGMAPMEFLRERRLDAARSALLLAAPGETSISAVALHYGFAQPSKFTALYKATFGETPSETLRG